MSLSDQKDSLIMNKKKELSRQQLQQKIQQLEEENLKLRIANAYIKNKRLRTKNTQEIVQAITELRHNFKVSLDNIFKALANYMDLPLIDRSNYYYTSLNLLNRKNCPS